MRRRIHPKPESGQRINNAVVSHTLVSRDIVRVQEHDPEWDMLNDPDRRLFRQWVNRQAYAMAFVWLDHPDTEKVAIFEAALKNAAVPVGIVRHKLDAIVAESVVTAPTQQDLKQSILDCIDELLVELGLNNRARDLIIASLEKVGVL